AVARPGNVPLTRIAVPTDLRIVAPHNPSERVFDRPQQIFQIGLGKHRLARHRLRLPHQPARAGKVELRNQYNRALGDERSAAPRFYSRVRDDRAPRSYVSLAFALDVDHANHRHRSAVLAFARDVLRLTVRASTVDR